ncbi:DnaT-like ssDNA-binding domain-containing protein [Neptunomonas japonica]|uniref:DnaT-like ssDNA-binding domain-containing protein n=1 Tax=Neptunomonas japonica TaxID=417574 RepID=UPI0003FF6A5C|nr:DnaT-like ssDNA-binding domain-containing protein [Neptunomonas japonica]
MSRLLVNEHPLIVLPSLAAAIGLNEAMVLQQVHFWANVSDKEHKGHKWFYRTMEEWQSTFRFWSKSTLERAIKSLKAQGLIKAEKLAKHFNRTSFDQTIYYTPNYENLAKIELEANSNPYRQNDGMDTPETTRSSGGPLPQIDGMGSGSLTDSECQNDGIRSHQNDGMLTENTTEKTTHITAGEMAPVLGSIPQIAPPDLFNTSLTDQQRFFPLHADWQPDIKNLTEQCRLNRVNLSKFDDMDREDALREFVSHWLASGKEFTQAQWEQRFIKQLKYLQDKRSEQVLSPKNKRAEVSAAVMNLGDTDW